MTAEPIDTTVIADIDAEQAVLGLALQHPHHLAAARAHLNGGTEFYRPAHEQLWRILCRQADLEQPTDPITVNQLALADTTLRRAVQSRPTLVADLYATEAIPDAGHYARTVADLYARRRLIEETDRTRRRALDLSVPIEQLQIDHLDRVDQVVASIERQADVTGPAYLDFEQLLTQPMQPETWHAAPLVAAGRITLLYSAGGSGKSLLAQEIATACALGAPVLDTPGTEPKHVLYIDQEMTPADWLDRLTDLGYDPTSASWLNEHLHLAQLHNWPPMDTAAGGAAVEAAARACRADIVIIDTVSKVIAGEENSNDTHAALYQHTLVPLKRLGCAVLILDHIGKDAEKGARGGSSKVDNVDLAIHMDVRATRDDGTTVLTLRTTKARFRDEHIARPTSLRRGGTPLMHTIEAWQSAVPTDAAGGAIPTECMKAASLYVQTHSTPNQRQMERALPFRATTIRLALDLLVEGQFIMRDRVGRSQQYTHVVPYEGEDL